MPTPSYAATAKSWPSFDEKSMDCPGTGTDNMIVIPSPGLSIDNAGGHSKMGELIAKAVYQAVSEAIAKQNGLTAQRSIFKRLEEPGVDLVSLGLFDACPCMAPHRQPGRQALTRLLLEPAYAGFLETAPAMSDADTKGLVEDWAAFEEYGRSVAERIAGGPLSGWCPWTPADPEFPVPLAKALEALLNGLMPRNEAPRLSSDIVEP